MTNPELTIQVDDFLVMRRPPATQEIKDLTVERERANADFISRLPRPASGGVLSGSFIYAHPPDYRGRPMHRASRQEWRNLFRELKEIGLGTVILQAAAWVDFGECYYPSRLLAGFRTWNMLDPMVAAAADEAMTLYLGGVGILYGHLELDADSGHLQKARQAADRELKCYRELLDRYRGGFQGYYLSPETGFHPGGRHYPAYHEFFLRITQGVKDLTPDLPILGSPYTNFRPGMEAETRDRLTELHAGCPFTALAPQDCMGQLNTLPALEQGLAIWKSVCEAVGAEFWVNCESFRIADYEGPVFTIEPARLDRFTVQLDTAARMGARKLITWEAPHFMAREGSEGARKLRREYAAGRCGK